MQTTPHVRIGTLKPTELGFLCWILPSALTTVGDSGDPFVSWYCPGPYYYYYYYCGGESRSLHKFQGRHVGFQMWRCHVTLCWAEQRLEYIASMSRSRRITRYAPLTDYIYAHIQRPVYPTQPDAVIRHDHTHITTAPPDSCTPARQPPGRLQSQSTRPSAAPVLPRW